MVLGESTKFRRRQALNTLPADLYNSFRGIITRIRERGSQEQLGMKVLMWLHCAYRPLELVELQHALSVEKNHTDLDKDNIPSRKALLDSCLGLVVVDEETLTVRFVHSTLEEYFRENAKAEFPNGCSSIAKTCLTYLNFGKLRQHCSNIDTFKENTKGYVFLDYAAHYWGIHVEQQCTNDLIRLAKPIVDHKSERPPCAIQALYSIFHNPSSRPLIAQKFSGIHAIAYFGLSDIMRQFFEVGRHMGPQDEFGRTPLSWAAEYV